MRLNKFLALHAGLSRRSADKAIEAGRVTVNGQMVELGYTILPDDIVSLDGQRVTAAVGTQAIVLNKPVGYVCSRIGQGSRTIYDLLPSELHNLKPVGRLDKDSSGLLLLTNDGNLAHQLTHPSFQKEKVYEVRLDKPLNSNGFDKISKTGVELEDGPSKLHLKPLSSDHHTWEVTMTEGRNRQIRRTFAALGYKVEKLHRTQLGSLKLESLESNNFKELEPGLLDNKQI